MDYIIIYNEILYTLNYKVTTDKYIQLLKTLSQKLQASIAFMNVDNVSESRISSGGEFHSLAPSYSRRLCSQFSLGS